MTAEFWERFKEELKSRIGWYFREYKNQRWERAECTEYKIISDEERNESDKEIYLFYLEYIEGKGKIPTVIIPAIKLWQGVSSIYHTPLVDIVDTLPIIFEDRGRFILQSVKKEGKRIDDNLDNLFYRDGEEFVIEPGILDEWVEDQFKKGLSQIPNCFGEITDYTLIDIMMDINEEYSESGRKRYSIKQIEELKGDLRKLGEHIKDLASQLSRCANCIYFERCLAYTKFKYEKEQDSKISEALDI